MTDPNVEFGNAIDDKFGSRFGEYKDAMELYEDGKHRRYTLLFSVNGAVAATEGDYVHRAESSSVSQAASRRLPD